MKSSGNLKSALELEGCWMDGSKWRNENGIRGESEVAMETFEPRPSACFTSRLSGG